MPEYVLDTSDAPDKWADLDEFTRAYIEAAMWTLLDTWRECQICGYKTRGEDDCATCGPAGDMREQTDSRDDLGAGDIAEATIRAAVRDCAAFQETFRADLDAATEELGRDDASHGHDFWLTREGHGAGFWDRGYTEDLSKRLTDGAHAYGEACWYVGDDNKVYQMGEERS